LPCTYLAHHELESVNIIIVIIALLCDLTVGLVTHLHLQLSDQTSTFCSALLCRFKSCCGARVQMVLKCADIGHLAADPATHKRWSLKLEEEFFRQVSKCIIWLSDSADSSSWTGTCIGIPTLPLYVRSS